jgi:hypothetical protein
MLASDHCAAHSRSELLVVTLNSVMDHEIG